MSTSPASPGHAPRLPDVPDVGPLCPSPPYCEDLITNPQAVLMDESAWPSHICQELAEASTWEWLNQRIWHGPTGLLGHWPLPVGRAAALGSRNWLRISKPFSEDNTNVRVNGSRLAGRMPFAGDETALLILRVEIETVDVELFGLGQELVTDDVLSYSLGPLAFRATSADCGSTNVDVITELVRAARKWWVQASGHIIRGRRGRPPGFMMSEVEFIDTLRRSILQYYHDTGRTPRVVDVQSLMALGKGTLQARRQDLAFRQKLPMLWRDLVDEVLSRER
jgi:hypothetical protein